MENKRYLIAALLGVLILSPPFIKVNLWSDTIKKPKVYTMSRVVTADVLGVEYTLQEFVNYTVWFNGTRKIHISIAILDVPGIEFRGGSKNWVVRVNMTQILNEQSLQGFTTSSPVVTYYWDNILFLKAPGNGTHYVKYDHPDNYWTYHPEEWYTHWEMRGARKAHVHLSAIEVQNWIDGVATTSDIVKWIFAGLGIGATVIAAIATFFSCPWAVVPAIIAAISQIIALIAEIKGTQLVNWIKDVVQAAHGDGWTWIWSYVKWSYIWWRSPFLHKPMTIWDFYEVREWLQSWGAERDSPQDYTVEWWSKREIKSAPTSAVSI